MLIINLNKLNNAKQGGLSRKSSVFFIEKIMSEFDINTTKRCKNLLFIKFINVALSYSQGCAGVKEIKNSLFRFMGKKTMQDVSADQQATLNDAQMLQNKPRAQKILLADDDLFIRSLIKKIIGNHVEIEVMTDGKGVVDQYRRYRHAMVLLDIHLPSTPGFKVAEEILGYDPEAHIVMLSSDSTRENVLKTKKIGAKSFIGKPFHKVKLMRLMDECPYLRYSCYKY